MTKKYDKKMGLSLLIIITIAFCFTSCTYKMTYNELDFLKLNAYISIPCLTDDCLRYYDINVLETDDYGRILYSIEVKTEYSNVDAIVIMQDYNDTSVMLYENLSYYLGEEDIEKTKILKEKKRLE